MASLEGDTLRSFRLVCEVIKDQVMSDIQSAAVKRRILTEDFDASDNLKALDALVRQSIDQSTRNSMRELQSTLKPYVRELQTLRLESEK